MNQSGKRDSWASRAGFVLACIGSAVGMGNIWLFPSGSPPTAVQPF